MKRLVKKPAPRSNFVVRLNDEERATLVRLAEGLGTTPSAVLRMLVRSLAAGELRVVRDQPPSTEYEP